MSEISITTARITVQTRQPQSRLGEHVTATWNGKAHSGTIVEVHDDHIVVECVL